MIVILPFVLQMLDRTKYSKTYYVQNLREKRIAVNSRQFKSLVTFENGISEINAAYKRIRLEIPVFIATYILSSAKKILISFMYDFVLQFVPLNKVALSHCDTDSCYCLFANESLAETVKPEKKDEFYARLVNHCSAQGKERHPEAFLPRTCCKECELVDSKYPGLWKLEKKAKMLCALASKTYICIGMDDSVKISSKGLNQRALKEKGDPYELFTSVLKTGISQGATNVGFRILKDKIFTYKCYRSALPYFYIKRKCITECGVFTKAYENMVLIPAPKQYFCLGIDAPELNLDDEREIIVEYYRMSTLRQAHCFMKFKLSCNQPRKSKKKLSKHEQFARILSTTNPKELSQIEREIQAEDDFYAHEFDIMYQLVGKKINKYPDILQSLAKAGTNYIANTCSLNARLGTGISPAETRWRESSAFIAGKNILGKVYMTYATMMRSTLKIEST